MTWDPWENADSSDVESAEESIKFDLKMLARYARKASALVEPFRKIGEALETKQILVYADRIEARVEDVGEMTPIIRQAPSLVTAFFDEIEGLCLGIADGSADPELGSELGIKALPTYDRLLALGEQLLKYEFRIAEEDDDQHINWTLEDYVGPEARIYERLQKLEMPALIEDDYMGARTIYGVLTYYDAEYIEMRVNELRDEREES